MPNVLDKTNVSLNSLTEKLFDLIASEDVSIEDIQIILAASIEFSKKESLKNMAIDFKQRINMKTDRRQRNDVSIFDVAAYTQSIEIMELLMDYIEQDKELTEADKSENFSSALCLVIGDKKLTSFNHLMKYKYYSINNNMESWSWGGHDNPLTIAIFRAQSMTFIYSLLLHNASPTCELTNSKTKHVETALSVANFLPETNEFKKQIITALECAEQLELARTAYFNKDTGNMFAALGKAISMDSSFVRSYLKNMAYCAVDQLEEPRDKTDYRFLLGFILAFASIMKVDQRLFNLYKHFGDFVTDTMQHILGAYDCEAEVPESVHKLFNSKDEMRRFFETPVVPALIENTSLKNTLTVMQGNVADKNSSVIALVRSMARDGILSKQDSAESGVEIEKVQQSNIKCVLN